MSDNGPQYSCALFKDFAREYRFTHITSSPRYPQANGEAECAVATVKGLWKGGGEKAKSLMSYRATPLESGYSPAQLLMGRQIRSTIPQLPMSLLPRWTNIRGFRKSEKWAKENQRRNYNLRHRARSVPPLQPGQNVWLPRKKKQGIVIQQATTPRSYIIHTDEGQVRRNRTHIRTVHLPQNQTTPPDTPDATSEPGNPDTRTHVTRDSNNHKHSNAANTPYVTTSGRVSHPPDLRAPWDRRHLKTWGHPRTWRDPGTRGHPETWGCPETWGHPETWSSWSYRIWCTLMQQEC